MGNDDKNRKRSLQPTDGSKPRLLLHCVDGCVPYLNPNQLEEHFPPSENTDLWLGLAVRDACVTPVYHSASDSDNQGKKKQKSKQKEPSAANVNKVRGYTFEATHPDPWLLPYTRLTVPSFGLSEQSASGNPSARSSKNSNNSVYVWTPHGRQKLTPDLYATASLEGLQSQHTLSLFDDFDEEQFSVRRKQKAQSRNEEWFHHLSSKGNDLDFKTGKRSLWKPILLPHQQASESDPKDETTNPSTLHQKPNAKEEIAPKHAPSGIAFVGRFCPDLRLDTILADAGMDGVPWKAMLTTHSLSEILEIATAGVANLIGTNLPQKWAKEKLALGVDLWSMESVITSEDRDSKRQKAESTKTEADLLLGNTVLNEDGCMDLSDKRYARDTGPLVPGCDSFVCRDNRFSRAYIHHLVVAKEMVAEILLFGHNLHCLLKLLRCFDCDESKRTEVKNLILRQLPSAQK